MKEQLVTKRSLGMAEMLTRAFPNLIPSEVRVNLPTPGGSDSRIYSGPLWKSIYKLQATHQEIRNEDFVFN